MERNDPKEEEGAGSWSMDKAERVLDFSPLKESRLRKPTEKPKIVKYYVSVNESCQFVTIQSVYNVNQIV